MLHCARGLPEGQCNGDGPYIDVPIDQKNGLGSFTASKRHFIPLAENPSSFVTKIRGLRLFIYVKIRTYTKVTIIVRRFVNLVGGLTTDLTIFDN